MWMDGQTDRLDEADSRSLQFCKRAYRPSPLFIKLFSKETYSAKCPGILPNMNKLSYEVTDHDIYIRWYVYDTVKRQSRPVPQGNLIDQQEAEIQM